MGMTGTEIVRKVELPLALPLIFGGIKTSAVNVVATATIAPLAGINTLGDPIINVSGYGDTGRLAAAIVVASLAIFTELALGAVQRAVTPAGLKLEPDTASRRMRLRFREGSHYMRRDRPRRASSPCCFSSPRSRSPRAATTTTTARARAPQHRDHRREAASAIESNPDNAKVTITVGSKNFTEQKVLGEIYAQGLEAAGYKVKKELNLGDEKIALKALEGGEISAYPEYTGTALGSFFGGGLGRDPEGPAGGVRAGQDRTSPRRTSPRFRPRRTRTRTRWA